MKPFTASRATPPRPTWDLVEALRLLGLSSIKVGDFSRDKRKTDQNPSKKDQEIRMGPTLDPVTSVQQRLSVDQGLLENQCGTSEMRKKQVYISRPL